MRKKDLEKETYLSEYKLAYITAGDAVLIDCKGRRDISAGTVLLLRPGYGHICRPLEGGRLVECSVCFGGEALSARVDELFPAGGPNLFRIGMNEELARLIASANDCAKTSYEHTELLFEATGMSPLAFRENRGAGSL